MLTGINAASHRWTGSLLKRDFLHGPDQQDPLLQTLSIRYQELSYEHATKAYHWSEHIHENTELILVKKGLYIGELNGQELELHAGHVQNCRPKVDAAGGGNTVEALEPSRPRLVSGTSA
jgi:hypothetical protein